MPFVPVPNVAEVEVRMTQAGQKIENTLYFDFGAEPDAATMLDLANDIEGWWETSLAPLISETVQLREIVVTSLTSETGAQVTVTPAIAQFGLHGDPPMPNEVSFAISFRTELRGRSFRGRNYAVGIVKSQTDGNNLIGATPTQYQTAYSELLGTAITGDQSWVVVSRYSGVDPDTRKPIPRVTGIATPVTAVVVVDSTVDSQRRRKPGNGT